MGIGGEGNSERDMDKGGGGKGKEGVIPYKLVAL
jgi:hypothetical protein